MAKINQICSIGLILCLRLYHRWVSPLLGPHCRFHPSCSCYAVAVIENRGIIVGLLLTLKRLLKCHPWHPGGEDPPPVTNQERM